MTDLLNKSNSNCGGSSGSRGRGRNTIDYASSKSSHILFRLLTINFIAVKLYKEILETGRSLDKGCWV